MIRLPRSTITKDLKKHGLCLMPSPKPFTLSGNYIKSHTPHDAVKASLATPHPESVCICNVNKLVSLAGTNVLAHQFQTVNTIKTSGL